MEFLTITDVLSLLPMSRSTLYLRMQDPDFPKSIKIGGKVLWKKSEIYAYIDSKQKGA